MATQREAALTAAAVFADSNDDVDGRVLLLALADLYGIGIVDPCARCSAPPFTSSEVSTYVNCAGCGTAAHARRPGG